MYPTAPVIAQHNQQCTSVEADRVTANTTGNTFAGKPKHERDIYMYYRRDTANYITETFLTAMSQSMPSPSQSLA